MDIEESGHTDVASAKNQVKIAMSALEKMRAELTKLDDEGSLPSWWTNKVAIAVDKLDGMADYLDTQVEEVELDEAMDKNAKLKIFNKLKKGDKIKIKYDSSLAKGKDYTTFVVTRNMSVVGKAKVEKIPLAPEGKTGGMKYYLYNRDGNVSFAMGDMGAAIVDMKEEIEMEEELSKIKGNTPADQGRRGAVEDDIKRAEKRGDKKAVAKLKEDELDEVIPKSTMYGVVVKGKFIAKGSKANMRKLAKEKGGKLYNSPRAKVGDSVGKSEEVELDEDAKMAKQSDDNLKSMMKKMRDAEKKDPKMPSTQFMIKRIGKEMKKRGLKEMNEDNELIQRVANAISFYEAKELDEKTKWKMGDGRPRGGSHIENERFWDLPKDSLEYIIKDAGDAMKANPKARKATTGRGNWADQVNDAQTVLAWRKKNGIKEELDAEDEPKVKEIIKKLKGASKAHAGQASDLEKAVKEELKLDEAKYEYDGKVVKISKKEFRKVHKDYKNSTKGKERMMILDPKTQGSISVPVQFEEVELDENAAVKALKNQADVSNPTDKKFFQKAAELLKKKDFVALGQHLYDYDTAPSEFAMSAIRDKDKASFKKMYGDQKGYFRTMKPKGLKEKVDENVQSVANAISFSEAKRMSPAARARRDALRDIGGRGKDDEDEVKATDADREKADRNIINKLKKAADVKGNYEIKFDKGPSKKIPYKFIKFALDKHAKMKPADKLKFQKQAEKSYVDFLKAVKDIAK